MKKVQIKKVTLEIIGDKEPYLVAAVVKNGAVLLPNGSTMHTKMPDGTTMRTYLGEQVAVSYLLANAEEHAR